MAYEITMGERIGAEAYGPKLSTALRAYQEAAIGREKTENARRDAERHLADCERKATAAREAEERAWAALTEARKEKVLED